MGFKEDREDDLDTLFDTEEFADSIQYDGITIPAIITRFQDPELGTDSLATRAQILVKKKDINFDYRDQVFFDEVFWSTEQIVSHDSLTEIISVRRDEKYVF